MNEPTARQSPAQVVFAGLLCLAIGLYLARDIGRASWAALKWSKTRAEITSSRLDCVYDAEGDAACNAYVDYTYEAEDGSYSAWKVEVLRNKIFSSRISLGEELAERYREGRLVDVYYNPVNQPVSDLGPDNAPSPLFALVFGLLGLAMIAGARKF